MARLHICSVDYRLRWSGSELRRHSRVGDRRHPEGTHGTARPKRSARRRSARGSSCRGRAVHGQGKQGTSSLDTMLVY